MYASGGYAEARFSDNCCPNLTIVVGLMLVLGVIPAVFAALWVSGCLTYDDLASSARIKQGLRAR